VFPLKGKELTASNSASINTDFLIAALRCSDAEASRARLEELCAGDEKLLNELYPLMRMLAFLGHASLGPPASPESVPDQLGPFKLLKEIGHGGMGRVYLARQLEPFQREVAVKVVRPGMPAADAFARFTTEYEALARLHHHHVASIYDAGEQDGLLYFAMEYLPKAMDLVGFCRAHDLGTEAKVRLCMQACQGIAHAHCRGILHRDIKPANIMVVDQPGQGPTVKVIDFGIAKAWYHPLSFDQSPETHGCIGTPAYMAPEQFSNFTQDTRTDVYGLGASFWMVFFDQPRHTSPETYKKSAPAAAPDGNTLMIHEARAILEKATAAEPDARYPNAAELHREFSQLLDGKPVQALAAHPTYVWRKRLWRRKKTILFAVLLLTLTAIAYTLQQQARRQAASSDYAARQARSQTHLEKERVEATRKLVTLMLQRENPQIVPMRDRDSTLHELEDYVEKVWAGHDDLQAEGFRSLAATLAGRDEFSRAIQLTQREIHIRTTVYPNQRHALRQAGERLAYYEYRAGMLESAECRFRELLPSTKTTSDQSHLDRRIQRGLAETLWARGKLPEALEHCRQLLKNPPNSKNQSGADLHEQGLLLLLLGHIQRDQSQSVAAEASYQKAHQLLTDTKGTDHPDTLSALESLALLLKDRHRHQAAHALFHDLLEKRRQLEGATSQATLRTQTHLAESLFRLNRNAEAQSLFESALATLSLQLGPDHPETLTCRHNLATVLAAMGHLDQAVKHGRALLAARSKTAGPAHLQTIATANNLADFLNRLKRHEEATWLLEGLLPKAREQHGDSHPTVLMLTCTLAETKLAVGAYDQARILLRQIVSEAPRAYPEGHAYHALFAGLYGIALHHSNHPEEARPYLLRAQKELPDYLAAYRQQVEQVLDDHAKVAKP